MPAQAPVPDFSDSSEAAATLALARQLLVNRSVPGLFDRGLEESGDLEILDRLRFGHRSKG